MKKSHGPDLRRQPIPLRLCSACHGRAVIQGLFHELDCVACNASGWVSEVDGQPLDLRDLVTHLSFNLQQARRELQRQALEQAQPRILNNRRGAGGSHFTGD